MKAGVARRNAGGAAWAAGWAGSFSCGCGAGTDVVLGHAGEASQRARAGARARAVTP